jgi:hypothetical protein
MAVGTPAFGMPAAGVNVTAMDSVEAWVQGLTFVHVSAQLEQLQDTFMS